MVTFDTDIRTATAMTTSRLKGSVLLAGRANRERQDLPL